MFDNVYTWQYTVKRWLLCKLGKHVWRYERGYGGEYPGMNTKSFCWHCEKQGRTIYD